MTKVYWIARDGGYCKNENREEVGVYLNKPQVEEDMPFFYGSQIATVPLAMFPQLTFENSPKQIKIEILDEYTTV
jgi:hypothetical protein